MSRFKALMHWNETSHILAIIQTRSDVVKVTCDEQWFCGSPNSNILGMEHK